MKRHTKNGEKVNFTKNFILLDSYFLAVNNFITDGIQYLRVGKHFLLGGGGGKKISWVTGLSNMGDGVLPTPCAQIGKYEKKIIFR